MIFVSNSMARYRRKRVKEEMRKQKASKITAELKDEIVNMSEEQQDELAQAIADIVNEEEKTEE